MDLLLYMVGVAAGPFFFAAMQTQFAIVNWIIALIGVILVVFWFIQAIKLFKKVIRQNLGLDAELATGSELNLLMHDGAWVFHDIPYQYGNIDHVIVSAGGVFAVETKGISKPTDRSKPGFENATLSVEKGVLKLPHATTSKPINQAKTHAKWIRGEVQRKFGISVPVKAVVALPGWMIRGGYDDDCWVINPKRGNALRSAITKSVLDPKQVQLIAAWIEDLARSVQAKSREFDPKT